MKQCLKPGDAMRILLGLREKYEVHHRCRYTLEAIYAAVQFSARYIPDRHLSDKAIDLIDEVGRKSLIQEKNKREKFMRTRCKGLNMSGVYGEAHSEQVDRLTPRIWRLQREGNSYRGHQKASVVLLDEIEKAHPDIFSILLQSKDFHLTDFMFASIATHS